MNEELEKVTLFLRRGDMKRIREIFPNAGGASPIVRQVIAKYVDSLSGAEHLVNISTEELELGN